MKKLIKIGTVLAMATTLILNLQKILDFVDTQPPIISLNDATIEVGTYTSYDWTEYVIEAKDNREGEVLLEFLNDNVNLDEVGNYTVTIRAIDRQGNDAEKLLNVSVVDNTPPTFYIVNQTVESGEYSLVIWDELITSANDNSGENTEISIKNNLNDLTPVGTYTVTLVLTDLYGNSTEKDVIVTIVDHKGPTIIAINQSIEYNSDYTNWESYFTLSDVSGVKDYSITYNDIDVTQIGDYRLELTAYDQYDNMSKKSITVNVVPLNINPLELYSKFIVKTSDICTHYVLGCTGADQEYTMTVEVYINDIGFILEEATFEYYDPWSDLYVELFTTTEYGLTTYHKENVESRYDLAHTDADLSLHSFRITYKYRETPTSTLMEFILIEDWN